MGCPLPKCSFKLILSVSSVLYVLLCFAGLTLFVVSFIGHSHQVKHHTRISSAITFFTSVGIIFFSFTFYGIRKAKSQFVLCGVVIIINTIFAYSYLIILLTVTLIKRGLHWSEVFLSVHNLLISAILIINCLVFWLYYNSMPKGVSEDSGHIIENLDL